MKPDYWKRDQGQFYRKLRIRLKKALKKNDIAAIEEVQRRLLNHLVCSGQSTNEALSKVWKMTKVESVQSNTPLSRLIDIYKHIAISQVQGGLVGSTKG